MIEGDRRELVEELQRTTHLGRITHCDVDIYTFDSANFPVLMCEVWRRCDLLLFVRRKTCS